MSPRRAVTRPLKQRDRTCRLTEHTAKGQGLIERKSLLDIEFHDPHRLIGEASQPQDSGLEIVRRNNEIEPGADHPGPPTRDVVVRQRPVEMTNCVVLIAEIVQRGSLNAIRHHPFDRIGGMRGQVGEPAGKPQGIASRSVVELIDAKTPEGAELIVPVAQSFSEFEGGVQRRAGLFGAADSVHQ
jgi:hypothetical protein